MMNSSTLIFLLFVGMSVQAEPTWLPALEKDLSNGSERMVKHELSNGLTILCCPSKGWAELHVGLAVNAGPKDELPHELGYTSIIHEMLFKGAGSFDLGYFFYNYNRGAAPSYSDFNVTMHEFIADKRYYKLFLDVIADGLATISFSGQEFFSAVKDVRDSITCQRAHTIVEQHLVPMMFTEGHPLRTFYNRFADSSALFQITPSAVRACYNRLYVPENMVITLVGDVEVDEALSYIEQLFGRLKNIDSRKKRLPATGSGTKEAYGYDKIPSYVYAWKLPSGCDPMNILPFIADLCKYSLSCRVSYVSPSPCDGFLYMQTEEEKNDQIDQLLYELSTQGPGAEDLLHCKRYFSLGRQFYLNDVLTTFKTHFLSHGTWEFLSDYPTKADIHEMKSFIKNYLTKEKQYTLQLKARSPHEQAAYEKRLAAELEYDRKKLLLCLTQLNDGVELPTHQNTGRYLAAVSRPDRIVTISNELTVVTLQRDEPTYVGLFGPDGQSFVWPLQVAAEETPSSDNLVRSVSEVMTMQGFKAGPLVLVIVGNSDLDIGDQFLSQLAYMSEHMKYATSFLSDSHAPQGEPIDADIGTTGMIRLELTRVLNNPTAEDRACLELMTGYVHRMFRFLGVPTISLVPKNGQATISLLVDSTCDGAALINEAQEVLSSFASWYIDEYYLTSAKRYYYIHYLKSVLNSAENLVKLYGIIFERHGSFEEFENYHHCLMNITKEQLSEAVSYYLNPAAWSISLKTDAEQ